MGTNAPYKPDFEGQLVVFPSPHASGVLLVDEARKDKYNRLQWCAIDHDDPKYHQAIAQHMHDKQQTRNAASQAQELGWGF